MICDLIIEGSLLLVNLEVYQYEAVIYFKELFQNLSRGFEKKHNYVTGNNYDSN